MQKKQFFQRIFQEVQSRHDQKQYCISLSNINEKKMAQMVKGKIVFACLMLLTLELKNKLTCTMLVRDISFKKYACSERTQRNTYGSCLVHMLGDAKTCLKKYQQYLSFDWIIIEIFEGKARSCNTLLSLHSRDLGKTR